jgi:hypothetical protein
MFENIEVSTELNLYKFDKANEIDTCLKARVVYESSRIRDIPRIINRSLHGRFR